MGITTLVSRNSQSHRVHVCKFLPPIKINNKCSLELSVELRILLFDENRNYSYL